MMRAPDLNFRPQGKGGATGRSISPSGLSGNLLPMIAFAMVLAAGGYHLVTVLSTNSLRANVEDLRYDVASGSATPEQAIVEELQAELDDITRHKNLVDELRIARFEPTDHIEQVIAALPSTRRSGEGTGMRFQSLALEAAGEMTTAGFQPLPDDAFPVATVTLQAIAPSNTVLEEDLRALESHDTLRANLRSSNRRSTTDDTDETVIAQVEILTLAPPFEDTQDSFATEPLPASTEPTPLEVSEDTTVSLEPTTGEQRQ